jgi:viroplasmin and RNaseH domain-containing protein
VNIGDYLLKKNIITKKQREKAELEHEVSGNKFGKCCLDLGFITRTELNQALKAIQKNQSGEKKTMATEIGENSKFTFDLKFIVTIGAVIVSASATYFSIMGSIDELKSANSPSRLEYTHLKDKIESIESNGDLKLITYQLEQFKETFTEIKGLASTLSPLASDLQSIKADVNNLKNKKIDIPDVDLSGIEDKIDALSSKIDGFEARLKKVEKNVGGRF